MLVVNNFVDQNKHAAAMNNLCSQLQKTSECSIDRISHDDFGPEFVEGRLANYDAIILSGSEALYSRAEDRMKFERTVKGIEMVRLPTLGICGGHQLLAMAYGEKIIYTGNLQQGYYDVEILAEDPLFEGLTSKIQVRESHWEIVENIPKRFSLLARSENSPIEAMKAEHGILYGVQFHPEVNDDAHRNGAAVLRNFARIIRR